MSDATKIQWADATFNPWIGCTKVSAGCKNCYAEARDKRFQGGKHWGKDAPRSRTSAANWKGPVRWNSEVGVHPDFRHKVFPSLCDWLDDEVPIEWFSDFLKLIHDTPHLDWLLLTKRPENFGDRLAGAIGVASRGNAGTPFTTWLTGWRTPAYKSMVARNVWQGVSVENQEMADLRIPQLLKIPAAVRFLSVEPMLEAIDLTELEADESMPVTFNALTGFGSWSSERQCEPIDWVIFGGESGSGARPCEVNWIRVGVKQCQAAGVAAFVKQLGAHPSMGREDAQIIRDRKGGDPAEWPADLWVREFPRKGGA